MKNLSRRKVIAGTVAVAVAASIPVLIKAAPQTTEERAGYLIRKMGNKCHNCSKRKGCEEFCPDQMPGAKQLKVFVDEMWPLRSKT